MKIHVIKKQTIETFCRYHPGARTSLMYWLSVLKAVDWIKPADILGTFGSADLLGNRCDRVVFNIGGNNYRVICHYVFGEKEVHLFIC